VRLCTLRSSTGLLTRECCARLCSRRACRFVAGLDFVCRLRRLPALPGGAARRWSARPSTPGLSRGKNAQRGSSPAATSPGWLQRMCGAEPEVEPLLLVSAPAPSRRTGLLAGGQTCLWPTGRGTLRRLAVRFQGSTRTPGCLTCNRYVTVVIQSRKHQRRRTAVACSSRTLGWVA
jgi:hypothetical protein